MAFMILAFKAAERSVTVNSRCAVLQLRVPQWLFRVVVPWRDWLLRRAAGSAEPSA